MNRYHARWVLPIAQPPIEEGWIDVDEAGRIAAVGRGVSNGEGTDLGSVALLPGLVNAHTHLELSYLHSRVPAATQFVDWIRGVVGTRRQYPDARSPEILDAIAAGIRQATAAGTALVGDISNTLVTFDLLRHSTLGGVVFHELLRFNAPDPDAVLADSLRQLDALTPSEHLTPSLAAHAPYSVAPALFQRIHQAAVTRRTPVSIHVSESPAESEFIAAGTGPWRTFLEDVGAWNPDWTAPGTTPVGYLDALGVLTPATLAVHGVQMTDADLRTLRDRGTTLIASPRSNMHTGAGVPPIARFYASGVRMAVGTDSLASTPDLNVFSEIATMRRLAPEVPASRLLESATRHGADALGFGAGYGTIEPGKRARLLAVRVPPGTGDVEEYLVGGIDPSAITWLDSRP